MQISSDWGALTSAKAAELEKMGLANVSKKRRGRSALRIVRANLFTWYNLVHLLPAALVVSAGSWKNLLFLGIVAGNFLIGAIQEIRAKRVLDGLSLLQSGDADAIRDGKEISLPAEKLVLGDVVLLRAGDQAFADLTVLGGRAEMNESMLTGESVPAVKREGDAVFSGSCCVSGLCAAKVTAVGDERRAEIIAAAARSAGKSEPVLKATLQRLIRVLSAFVLPIGAVLFISDYYDSGLPYAETAVRSAAAMLGMIPDGLWLLTSVSFTEGVIRLGRHGALPRDLYSYENLARADVLCLDKTGTLTTGADVLKGIVPLDPGFNYNDILSGILTALPERDGTTSALEKAVPPGAGWAVADALPFSSERRYCAADFGERGVFLLGAPEALTGDPAVLAESETYAGAGNRVLLLSSGSRSDEIYRPERPLCFLLLGEEIRPGAGEILRYFLKNGVSVRILSGDSPLSVAFIAEKTGIPGAESCADASSLSGAELADAVKQHVVFGRVSPEQKQEIIRLLKAEGHTVAMFGDGVNDVPALREADFSAAIKAGSPAARHAADMVLPDFDALPEAVAEGRRVVHHTRKTAVLFLSKTFYSFALAAALLVLPFPYPFVPIQMTLIGALATGIPGLVLSLEPRNEPIPKQFMRSVLKWAFLAGATAFFGVLALLTLGAYFGVPAGEISTACVYYTAVSGLTALTAACMPLNLRRAVLIGSMFLLLVAAAALFPGFFLLAALHGKIVLILICLLPLTLAQVTLRWCSLREVN
ncbi:MAG TPA: HAD-IC family P-type ATPase [Oscillospiraceae bacterium]|nr:HAD-IC family P-type ATPase [Oscillospiraceae bacterium]HNW04687.1 HAD-IC family P-type ATPase [Oscillospiraceae bacterium]